MFKKLFVIALLFNTLNADVAQRVFGSSPPMTYLIYTLAPQKLAGLNFAPSNINNLASPTLLDASFLDLPIIGSFHGGGSSINIETLLSHKVDLILFWEDDFLASKVSTELAKTGIKRVDLKFRRIADMPASILKAGKAMGEVSRAKELSTHAQKLIDELTLITKDAPKVRYYYAEGVDGLQTECSDSFHTEAMSIAGGENVHKCTQSNVLGLEKITFETLLSYNPEVIIAQNAQTLKAIKEDPLFLHLDALKQNRVFVAPNDPFNWLDRPPSFMRLLGMHFIAKEFYPELYSYDLVAKTVEFYKLFLRVDLSKSEAKQILGEKQ